MMLPGEQNVEGIRQEEGAKRNKRGVRGFGIVVLPYITAILSEEEIREDGAHVCRRGDCGGDEHEKNE